MEQLECVYNRTHLVCHKPILVFNCNGSSKFACFKCVQNEADFYGAFQCKICNTEHKIRLLTKLEESEKHKNDYETNLNENSPKILEILLNRLKNTKLDLIGISY